MSTGIKTRSNGVSVCGWGEGDTDYAHYHDTEWGMPVTDDVKLYEKMCLEGFQAGLSWLTILRKRENFRVAFGGFEIEKVAGFGDQEVQELLNDSGIVRHRGKIEATINNAQAAVSTIERYGSLAKFFWGFEPAKHQPAQKLSEIAAKTTESEHMSKELKKLGWRFVGPTTCYSLMQADGIVNAHLTRCFRHPEIEVARKVAKKSL